MHPAIRKTLVTTETLYVDGGKAAEKPLVMIAAAAVIRNPWAGLGYVDDLAPQIREFAPILGELLTGLILKEAGSGEKSKRLVKARSSALMASWNTLRRLSTRCTSVTTTAARCRVRAIWRLTILAGRRTHRC